jgi:hypothetical protein
LDNFGHKFQEPGSMLAFERLQIVLSVLFLAAVL